MKGKLGKRALAFLLAGILAVPVSGLSSLTAEAESVQSQIMERADKTLKLWYDEPARITGIDDQTGARVPTDTGFQKESLPLGCGYMGVNVFGGTEKEVVYVTENSLQNPHGKNEGMNLFAKTWIDFGHKEEEVTDYTRDLVLDDATSHVVYTYKGVKYSREYFTSYPDKVMAIKLDADKKGALSFTLSPEIPFLCDNTDGKGKSGTVTADADTGIITLKGKMNYYQINFEGQYKVIPTGGTMTASDGKYGGQLEIKNADSALILLAVGTNYELGDKVFTASAKSKLNPNSFPHDKVSGYINDASQKTYQELRASHVADYQKYFSRVSLDLGENLIEDSSHTTDQLLENYKAGKEYDPYLEELFFQYGRYLLIASSREGCLPANLQGIWNAYEDSPWGCGYWHNINVQMNYWPAFVTNMPELFKSYSDFNEAFRKQAQKNADRYLTSIGSKLKEADGQNGWAVGTGVFPYSLASPAVGSHSGPGTGAFTSMLFWDWYDFTRDEEILRDHTYPAVEGMAKFLSKSLISKDGLYLISPSASPENADSKQTVGCAFDQQMTWENHKDLLQAAEVLGITDSEIVKTVEEQIDKLDPVNIGYSGQVKEYREENYYADFGDPLHRHISQLVGLYPGTSITQETPAWMDAAKISLENRGIGTTGWSIAHRMCAWTRTGDGEKSYQELQQLFKERLAQNLWNIHPPFQIDANFGGTAGIAEMLLQSQAGYIEPLAAIPDAWADGSYEGLLARGNFVVGAKWKNGSATSIEITAQSGGSCSVKYPGLADAVIRDHDGNVVDYSVDSEDMDRITFDTVVNQTYTIENITPVEEIKAPSDLKVTNVQDGMQLQWEAGENAASYRVYQAVNDAADYELVADDVVNTEYIYGNDMASRPAKGDRVTMRVTAVGNDGRESAGTTAVILPCPAPENVVGILNAEKKLELRIDAVKGAEKYVVYQQDEDSWKKILETNYTTAYIENASEELKYAVTAIGDGGESDRTEVDVSTFSGERVENILLGKPVEMASEQTVNSSYPLTNVVNGKVVLKGSTKERVAISGKENKPWSMVVDLEGVYTLDKLSIAEWLATSPTRSPSTKVEILTPEGKWTTVKEGFPLKGGEIVEVDMNSVEAAKIRFTFDNTTCSAPDYASITEVMCSGQSNVMVDKQQLFQALQSIRDVDFGKYVMDPVVKELESLQREGIQLLQDTGASQQSVDTMNEKLRKAIEEFQKIGKNILLNQRATFNCAVNSDYPEAYMVDGDSSTRCATEKGASLETVTAEVALDGTYRIDSVYIQEFVDSAGTRGDKTSVEVLSDGNWTTVMQDIQLSSKGDANKKATNIIVFDHPVIGNAVRFNFTNTNDEFNRVSIWELQAAGEKLPSITSVDNPADISVEDGTDINALGLPSTVAVQLDDGSTAELGVEWNLADFDNATAGTYTLTGVLALTEGIYNPDGITASVNVIVWSDDWSRLDAAIADGQSRNEEEYTPDSWSIMVSVLEEAIEFQKNAGHMPSDVPETSDVPEVSETPEVQAAPVIPENPTQEEIIEMAEKLESVIQALVKKGDKTELVQSIESANALEEKYYTADTWSAVQEALMNAENVNSDQNAAQTDVDAAKKALEDALQLLKLDTSELETLIAHVDTLKSSEYTADSWTKLVTEQAKARTLLLSKDLTGEAVQEETSRLQAAIDSLEKSIDSIDTKKLTEVIKEAESIKGGGYTNESYQKLLDELKKAKEVLADKASTQETIDQATANLMAAIEGLKPIEQSGSGDSSTDDNGQQGGDLNSADGSGSSGNDNAQTNKDKSVQTGDTTSMILWWMLLTASMAGIIIVIFRRKRQIRE